MRAVGWGLTIRKPVKKKDFKEVKVTLNGYDLTNSWGTKEFLSKRRVMPQWALDMKRDEYKTDKDNDKKNSSLVIKFTRY